VVKSLRCLLILVCLLLLGGCNAVPVAEDLDQIQANEIVATLNTYGISAFSRRATGGRARYSVEVKRGSYSAAVGILNSNKLPSEPRLSFSDLVAQKGLIPNSRDVDYLRLDRALAIEVEESLALNPAVDNARAVVRMHSAGAGEPAVSVVLSTYPALEVSIEDVRQLIRQSLPGVKDEHILVSLYEKQTGALASIEGVRSEGGTVVNVPLSSFLVFWSVPDDDSLSLTLILLISIISVSVVAGFSGYIIGYSRQERNRDSKDKKYPQIVSQAIGIDRVKKNLPEVK